MCEEVGIKIINGTKKGDKEGEVTFIGGKDENQCSVLDLGLAIDRGGEDGVENFRILRRIESDHLPIELELKRTEKNEEKKEKEKEETEGLIKLEEDKLKWKKEKAQDYSEIAYELWREKKEDNNEFEWSDIKEIIKEAAKKKQKRT
ncbi:uncharacterized protein LOC141537205 [Cotesia typhae]|uniref:uncharacterized protein LOC141537205 n=1 Tax=Cotesia typhae TaxID=2053667 RepID=UPI003D69038E